MNNENNTVSCINWNPRPEWERWTGSNKCPHCGSDEIEYNTQIVLASNPPQSQLRCKTCGHYFSSGVKAEWINEDALNKVWEHVKDVYGISEIRDPLPGEIPYIGDWPPGPTITDPTPGLDNWKPFPIQNDSNKVTGMYGWICPKCGAVLAPHINSCPHCSPATTINITY